ncbi:MAG: hypothetical protein ABI442_04695 [Gemmatimonadaceae bacterium]
MPRRLRNGGSLRVVCTMTIASQLRQVLDHRNLSFPITESADFVEQMVAGGETVEFRGVVYDTRLGATLLPDFFFPLESAEDLLQKTCELLVVRGLAPASQLHDATP